MPIPKGVPSVKGKGSQRRNDVGVSRRSSGGFGCRVSMASSPPIWASRRLAANLGAAEGGVVAGLEGQSVSGGDLRVVVNEFVVVGFALLTTRAELEADAGLLAEANGSTDHRLSGQGWGEEESGQEKKVGKHGGDVIFVFAGRPIRFLSIPFSVQIYDPVLKQEPYGCFQFSVWRFRISGIEQFA